MKDSTLVQKKNKCIALKKIKIQASEATKNLYYIKCETDYEEL